MYGGRGGLFPQWESSGRAQGVTVKRGEWSRLLTETGRCHGDIMGIECDGPCTGFEHQGAGQRNADIANEIVGFEQAGVMNPRGEVGYQEAYDIENGHGAYLVYPSPTSGQKHDEGWDAKEV